MTVIMWKWMHVWSNDQTLKMMKEMRLIVSSTCIGPMLVINEDSMIAMMNIYERYER